MSKFLSLLPFLAALIGTRGQQMCDVAIIGGGAGGANAAVFLKDKGYKVCVLEQNSYLGGHCHTEPLASSASSRHAEIAMFNVPPNCSTCPNWVDWGVVIYQNSTWLQENGLGNWSLKTDVYLQRFLGANRFIPLAGDGSGGSQYYNLKYPNTPVNVSSNTTAFAMAYGRLVSIVSQYPWLEESGVFPDPIPPALLVPFSDFIAQNQLEPLTVPYFGPQLYTGGLGSFANLTTLYALLNLHRGILCLGSQPCGWLIAGGCSGLYQGIAAYLNNSVYYNATVLGITRPAAPSNGNGNKIIIRVQLNGQSNPTVFRASRLIIAIPPTADNLAFLDADSTEQAAFNMVKTRVYVPALIDVGSAATSFGVSNVDPSVPNLLAKAPTVTSVNRALPYGPAIAYFVSDTPLPDDQIVSIINSNVMNLPPMYASNPTISEHKLHVFQPHFSASDLAKSPSPYTTFNSLQGRRSTYYVGATLSFAESSKIWNHAYNLVQRNFGAPCQTLQCQTTNGSWSRAALSIPLLFIVTVLHMLQLHCY